MVKVSFWNTTKMQQILFTLSKTSHSTAHQSERPRFLLLSEEEEEEEDDDDASDASILNPQLHGIARFGYRRICHNELTPQHE